MSQPSASADAALAAEVGATLERAARSKAKAKGRLDRVNHELRDIEHRLKHMERVVQEASRAEAALSAGQRARMVDDPAAGASGASAASSDALAPAVPPPAAEDAADTAMAVEDVPASAGEVSASAAGGGAEAPMDAAGRRPGGGGRHVSPRARQSAGDGASTERNKKMFGMLMGTLRRARDDDRASGIGAVQQAKLQKVDEKIRSDRVRLIGTQKAEASARLGGDQQRQRQLLGEKDVLVDRLRALAALHQKLSLLQFVKTDAEPPLYYQPKVHNAATSAKLREQQERGLGPLSAELERLEELPEPTPARAEAGQDAAIGGCSDPATSTAGTAASPGAAAARTTAAAADQAEPEPEEPAIGIDGVGEEEPLAALLS